MVDCVVCVKQTVDVNQLRPKPDTLEPDYSKAPTKISDFDLNALEEALRIREKHGGKVYVISAGSGIQQLLIREALAMGADEAYVVSDPALSSLDGLSTANVLASLIKSKIPSWDLILCGEASLDESAYETGPRLAEALGIPSISYATKVELENGYVKAWKGMGTNVHVVKAKLPALITVGLEINTPRLPSLLMIRAAGKKPLHELKLSDIGIEKIEPVVETRSVKAVKVERKKQVIEGEPDEVAQKLVDILIQEGLVKKG